MVPEGWKLVTIGDLTSSHSYGPRFSAKDYDVNGTVKTIRNTDVTETGEILYEQVPTARLDTEIVDQHKLQTGDLIVITTADCGLSAIFEEQNIAYIPSAYAVRYRLNQTVLPTFIKYFMHTSIAQKQVDKFIRKGTVANLPGSDVLKIKLALPPLSEQAKIAAILSSVDEAIASTQAVIDQTRKVKQGLLQQLLTRGIGHTKFKQSELGKIPENWKVVRLYEIAASQRSSFVNGPFGSNLLTSELRSSGVPVIYIKDIKNSFYKPKETVYVSEEKADELSTCEVKPGDVLITKVGEPPTTACIYPNGLSRAIITQDVIRLRVDLNKSNPEFVRAVINSPLGRGLVEEIAIEGTRKRVALGTFKNIWFPLPPLRDFQKIKYTIKNNDNHYKGRERLPLAASPSPFCSKFNDDGIFG